MTPPGDIQERIRLEPDARLVEALGANHSLHSALADLVDNSIDAGASHVAIRFVRRGLRVVRVEVADDGEGMDAARVTNAMTIGGRREYSEGELGRFGMGLKSASFSHSDVLTVWSHKYRSTPVGRRIRRADFSRDYSCEVLTREAASAAESARRAVLRSDSGTLIVWTEFHPAYEGANKSEAETWVHDQVTRVRDHLGVVFHRLIADDRIHITTTVAQDDDARSGIPLPVTSIDPFGYQTTGFQGYPKQLTAQLGDGSIQVTCHIWPSGNDVPGFRIGGRPGEEFQGVFVYRNDRVLQYGGWSQLANASTKRQLARMVLDDPTAIGRHVTMNPEKQGLRFEQGFVRALHQAKAKDGTTFERFLQDAEQLYGLSRQRTSVRKPAVKPDKGFAPKLRKVISQELPIIDDVTVKVQWKALPWGEFFDIDRSENTVWLNTRHRELLVGGRGSLNDAPVIKALVYLLTREVFRGSYLGARQSDDIALWKAVLSAAVEAESELGS